MCRWAIHNVLARGSRPGYYGERGLSVPKGDVDAWISKLKALGIKFIICLLAEDQLPLYAQLPTDLTSYYRKAGFTVEHVPVRDRQQPPLSDDHLEKIWRAYQALPKPVLIHCSAGVDRTGQAVEYIQQRLERAS